MYFLLLCGKSVQRYCFFLNWQNFCMFFFKIIDFICRYEIFFVPLHAKYTRVKRALYILGVLLAGLALVGGTFIAALSSDKVKTAAVRLAAAELSRALGTNAQVGSVSYQFPAKITIKDIYLEDRQGDTLAYVGEAFAQFSPLALRHGEIKFSHVRLNDVLADVHQIEIPSVEGASTKEWNYQFLVDAFRTDEKKASNPMRSIVAVKDVQLDNIRLRYEDYEAFVSHADMDLHRLSAETLDAEITELSAVVDKKPSGGIQSPLVIKDFDAHVILTDSLLHVPMMHAQLPQSELALSEISLRLPFAAASLETPLRIDAELVPAEISLFVPALKTLRRPIGLTGSVSGALDSVAFSDMVLRYNGKPLLQGDVVAIGLPDMSNPYLRANLTDVHTNAAQMQDFLSQLNGRPIRLPQEVHRLGDIHYRGLAQGRLHDLTLHGAFRTALGAISTDGTFRSDSAFAHMTYDARVVGKNFRLGRMLNLPQLQTVTLDLASQGKIDNGSLSGDVKAHVRKFTYKNYTYADLHINGKLQPRRYEGKFWIADPHLDMAFDGVVNLRQQNPEVNFNLRCRHFDTSPILDTSIRTSFALAVDMNGKHADDISGYMVLDSLFLATPQDSVLMKQMTLLVSADGTNSKAVTLRSDYLSAQLDGTFRYADIVPAFTALAHHYLPAVVDAPSAKWQPVSFRMKAYGSELSRVQKLFAIPVKLSDSPSLRAEADLNPSAMNQSPVSVTFLASDMEVVGKPLQDIRLSLGTESETMALDVSASADNLHTGLRAQVFRDTLLTDIRFSSLMERPKETDEPLTIREQQLAMLAEQRAGAYGGDLHFETHFARYNKAPLIDLHCLPGIIMLRDSVYTLGESRLSYCASDTTLSIRHFLFEGAGQHLYANGVGSRKASDTLTVDMQRIDASYVVPFLLPQKTIMFNGLLTGSADITSLFRRPQIETRIHIDSLGLNNCHLGDAEVDLHISDSLAFHADVFKPHMPATRRVALDGKALFDHSGVWELDMTTDSVPLEFINHWTNKVLTDLDGYGSGRVVVGGRKGLVYVLSRALAHDAHLTLPWTGARYGIPSDSIIMDTTAIIFPDVHLTDAEGNPVRVQGAIHHEQFHDFVLDLHTDVTDALVFDNDAPGEMLRGKVYATGQVDVTGHESDILVSANASTSKNSRFRLSLDNASSAYESSFVHFVAAGDTLRYEVPEDSVHRTIELARPERCTVKLNLDINPFLLFQLVLGESNGDMIQGRGTGALRLTYDTSTGDVSLLGTYDINQGTLSYTVANMIRKEFTVGEGSTIVFSGNPSNPQLDVTAKYRVVASLRDLFGDDAAQLATTRSNIPVLTCLHMTGTLTNPILSFALEFPMSDQNIQQQVRQIINTDEMLMRQVIYLLVFGRFFTPDYMANAQYATLNSTYSLLSSTVTSQINAWLSKLTDMLTLGVAIRTDGEGAGRSQEYEAQFQLQPVDRLVINGNVGYRYNDISNQPFFGDLDVEVLLTEDGQLRLKGYTHTVDKYSLRQASTIQGVGLVWKIDF